MTAHARDRVVCVGNATLDRTFAVIGAVHLATSNPSNVRASFGGVARNVAENLARLGVPVGIDVRGVLVSATLPTAEYVAVIDARRELVIGASETGSKRMKFARLPPWSTCAK